MLVADTDLESGAEARDDDDDDDDDEEEEEEQQQQQKQQASAEVAITNTGQRYPQPNCATVCVLPAPKKGHSV